MRISRRKYRRMINEKTFDLHERRMAVKSTRIQKYFIPQRRKDAKGRKAGGRRHKKIFRR